MNILQILPRLDLGGVERGVVDFSRYLIRQGHKMVVISSGGRLVSELEASGAKHYTLPVHKKSLPSVIGCIPKVKEIVLKEKIDIVHGRSRIPDLIGFFAGLKTPADFVATAHGYYSVHLFSRIVGLAKMVICPGRTIAGHLTDKFNISSEKIRVIPRGLSLEEFGFVSPEDKDFGEIRICFLGRISPVKGVEYFIKAIDILRRKFTGIKAYIAGKALSKNRAYESYLRNMVKKYGLSENIEFTGIQNSAVLLGKCHFLILPSLIPESFGRVLIEAQAKGVLCIATNTGGPVEIIEDGKTGFLVPKFDSESIAGIVTRLAGDKILYSDIARTARKKVEDTYTLEKMSDSTLKVYRETRDKMSILIIKVSALGDVVLGTAAVRSLKKRFPHARMSVLCGRRYFKVIEGQDFIDEIVVCRNSSLREAFRLSGILRKKNFDLIFDLQNNHFSHLLSFLSFPKKSIGFNRKWGGLLDKKADFRKTKGVSPLESQKTLLKLAGIDDIELPEISVSQNASFRIEKELKDRGINPDDKLAGINIEASPKWKTKNLKEKRLSELVDFLVTNKKVKVVLIGALPSFRKGEVLSAKYPEGVFNFCGRTDLSLLTALIKRVNLFITPDSAPFHIAVSLGTKVIAFFGPTDPKRHAVLNKNVFIVRREINCLACYRKQCPDLRCMDIETGVFEKHINNII